MRTLDRILDAGFIHYHAVRRSHGLRDGSYLETGHLNHPHAIRLPAGNFLVTIDPWSFSGNFGAPADDGQRVCKTLEIGLHRMLEIYDRGLAFMDDQWMAVFRVGVNAEFYIFNPHPIGQRGHHTGGPYARAFRTRSIKTAAEVLRRTAKPGWNGNFALNGVRVQKDDNDDKACGKKF